MLEKIKKISKILNESSDEKELTGSLKKFFSQDFGIKNFYIEVYGQQEDNEKPVGKDYVKFPFYKYKRNIGNLCFSDDNENLKDFLHVVMPFISLKIQNLSLSEKMQKNIDFHETMKDIANVLETQYELSYVVPIIGEMVDKFFEDYLLYIFLKDESTGVAYLAWPVACKDENILGIVNNFEEKIYTDDKRLLALPLRCEGKNVGVLVAKSPDEKIKEKDEEYLVQLANQIATTINRANVYAEILKYATLDALTGFYNRRQLEERIRQEVSNARRRNAPLCGIMTDIDFFKSVNDTYGHAVGDLVLKTIAKVIRSQLREYDIAGRYGGEEFSILLPFTRLEEARLVGERLRKAIESKVINISHVNPDADVKEIKVTISLGVYEIKPGDKEEDLLKKADKALYEAKNTGRNKVVVQNA